MLFNMLIAKCNKVYYQKYKDFLKDNNHSSKVAFLKDEKNLDIILTSYTDILHFCISKAYASIEDAFSKDIVKYN